MRPGHELLWVGVLVVLDALQQRVGAVPDADDGDADLLLRAPCAVGAAVRIGHRGSSLSPAERDSIDERRLQTNVQVLRERLNDYTVRVRSALEGLDLEPPFQLRGHPEHDDRAFPGSRSSPSCRLERDTEPACEDGHRHVVERAVAPLYLLGEAALQLGGHPHEHALRGRTRHSASTIALCGSVCEAGVLAALGPVRTAPTEWPGRDRGVACGRGARAAPRSPRPSASGRAPPTAAPRPTRARHRCRESRHARPGCRIRRHP